MQAPRIETQTLPPPPGIIGSLRTGFDAIAGNVGVILMPLALDLLLWLGPHLSLNRLIKPLLTSNFQTLAGTFGSKVSTFQASQDVSSELLQALNLLGFLRTFPVGVSSLMSGSMPINTPWGAATTIEIVSPAQVLGLALLLPMVGWILGALYFRWVAALATPAIAAENRPGAVRAILQTVIYGVVWSIIAWVVGTPISILLAVLMLVNGALYEVVRLLLLFMSMWLIVPIFFSSHGMFVRKQGALASIQSGFELTRFTLPTSSIFVLIVFLLGWGLNAFLWSMPADSSWLVVVGIFGHAFITTALLASSFVYYNNMTAWLQMALARLRAGLPGQQAS
jgi:hypothetical protein